MKRIVTDRILLNIDVRNRLRLGDRFEIMLVSGIWIVKSLTKKPRMWRADKGPRGFEFTELPITRLRRPNRMRTEPQKPKCKSTNVDPRKDITINEIVHAGIVTHSCTLDEGHEDEYCLCACKHRWRKFHTVT